MPESFVDDHKALSLKNKFLTILMSLVNRSNRTSASFPGLWASKLTLAFFSLLILLQIGNLQAQTCTVTDYLYLNDVTKDNNGNGIGYVHKLRLNPGISATEIYSSGTKPWFPAGGVLKTPHGLGQDLNGNLYIGQTGDGPIAKIKCNGTVVDANFINDGGFNVVSKDGYLYIDDNGSNRINRYSLCDGSAQGYIVLNGSYTYGSETMKDWGLEIDPDGTFYVTAGFNVLNNNKNTYIYRFKPTDASFTAHTAYTAQLITGVGVSLKPGTGDSGISNTNEVWGITHDPAGNMYIVVQDRTDDTNKETWILKYNKNFTLVDYIMEKDDSPTGGIEAARGIVYYAPWDRLLIAGGPDGDCVAKVRPSDMVYTGALAPNEPGQTPKTLRIASEACPTAASLEVAQTLCGVNNGDKVYLQNIIGSCKAPICGGTWTASSGNAGITFNECDLSFTVTNVAIGCGKFTLKNVGGTCGDFTITVNVDFANVTAPVLGGTQTVCADKANTASITQTTPASGSNTIKYRWQKSTASCTDGFSDIAGATASTYTPGILSQTTHYRVITTVNGSCATPHGSCADTSNCVTISTQVCCNPVGGTVSGGDAVCASTNNFPAGFFTVSGYTGTIVRWEFSLDNANWNNWGNAGSTASPAGSINAAGTFYVRVFIQDGTCPGVYSSTKAVRIDGPTVGGTVSGGTPVCASDNNFPPGFFTLTGQTGSVVRWEYSLDNTNWTDWGNAGSTTSPNGFVNTAGTFYVRVLVQNGTCAAAYSSTKAVQVITSVGGTVSGGNSVCASTSNLPAGFFTVSGYTGTIVRWEYSIDNANWNDWGNAGSTASPAGSINTAGTFYVRVLVQNGSCAAVYSSTKATVVNTTPNAGGDQTLVCSPLGVAPTTATFSPVTTGGVWTAQAGNPATATIAGNTITGLTASGTYNFLYSLSSGGLTCSSTAKIIVPACTLVKASLGDFVFEDVNANGIQDATDKPIAGVTVTLLSSGTLVATAITNASGLYSFTGLTPGVPYSVSFTAPAGFTATAQNIGNDGLDSDGNPATGLTGIYSLTANENNPTVDMGYYKPASLGDYVWIDANKNGQQDAGESPIPGVTVTLVSNGTVVATTTTNANGLYSFTGLIPGKPYSVSFTTPANYTATTSNTGNDATDSDPINGITGSVTLASGENNPTLDAGFYLIPAIRISLTTAPVCNSATNNYAATATVSLTSASAGTLTITNNGSTIGTISVTAGQATATLSVSGLSDANSHTLIASFNGLTSTTTYVAPVSCTVCTVNLVTSTLPNGQVGTAYSRTLVTSGGTTPYTYAVSTGTLPAGLSLNATTGVISGTPTAATTSVFSIKVTDAKSCTDVQSFTITTAALPVCSLDLVVTPGTCTTATNQYSISGTVGLTNPVAGNLVITDGAKSTTIAVTASTTSVVYSLTGLVSGSGSHTVVASLAGCGTDNAAYTAPASCTVAPCALNVVVTPGSCNSATNQYSISGTVAFTSAVAGTLSITDGVKSTTVAVTAGATSVAYSLTGLTSGSGSHTVVASLAGCGTDFITYAAPASCTVCTVNLVTSTLPNGQVGGAYSRTLVTSGGTTPYTYAVSTGTLPAGLSLNATTGVISGTPTAATTSVFSIKVTDAKSCTDVQSFTITTAALPVCSLDLIVTPSACNSVTNQYAISGTVSLTNAVAGTLTITDGAKSTTIAVTASTTSVVYSLTGLTSGSGSHTVTSSLTGCGTDFITYSAPASCTVCTVNLVTSTLPNGQVGSAYSRTLVTSGGTTPYTYAVSTGSLPAGLSLNATTGVISGTPTAATTSVFSIKVTDAKSCTDVTSLTIVTAALPVCSLDLVVTPGTCNSATNQYSISGTVGLTNPTAGNLVITDGVKSTTLTITASTTSVTYSLTGLVSGSGSHTVIASLAGCGTDNAAYTAPASCTVCSLSLVTSSLPNGQVGTAYSQTITATGGTAPLTYSTSAGSLPVGLSLNPTTGVIAGIPTAAGSFTVTFTVTDSKGCRVSLPLTVIDINTGPVCSIGLAVTPGVCSSATNTFTLSGTVSLTNNTTGGTITITNGLVSTTLTVSNSATSVPFSLTGFVSDGLVHTLTATLTGCGTSSTTYTAPQSCTTACQPPIHVCKGTDYAFQLDAPTGQVSYQWYRNGVVIANATQSSFTATQAGSYSVVTNGNAVGQCPNGSCCPVVIVEDSIAAYQGQAQAPTCSTASSSVANADGRILVTNWRLSATDTTRYFYQVSLGSRFNAAQVIGGSTLSTVPADGVLVASLPNPALAGGQAYTVRIRSGLGCEKDVVVILSQTICSCPPARCVPFVVKRTR